MKTDNVNERYSEDHRHLQQLFHRFQSLKATDQPGARQAFGEFKSELERHILWEERILFPWFDHKCGSLPQSPIALLHREHEQFLVWLEDISQKLARDNFATDADEKNLESAIHRHNQKEEAELFPALDRVLGTRERRAVFAAMEERPGDRSRRKR